MTDLTLLLSEKTVRGLSLGDAVTLSGTIVTGRDAAHKFMVESRPDFIRPFLAGGALYHCGPVVNRDRRITSAGPTTSIREEPYEARVIEEYGLRAVIGKGGMGADTAEALRRFGCVYIHAVGGAGTLAAGTIRAIRRVFCEEEFGSPEAFWVLEVDRFPGIVTMDARGDSLHKTILEESRRRLADLL